MTTDTVTTVFLDLLLSSLYARKFYLFCIIWLQRIDAGNAEFCYA
jgi:hypothetical protein